jgi:hypothetical protein
MVAPVLKFPGHVDIDWPIRVRDKSTQEHLRFDGRAANGRGALIGLVDGIDRLSEEEGIKPDLRDDFRRAIKNCIDEFKEQQFRKKLPDKPLREYEPRRDNIIDYLRSEDGFGPWVAAGALTRPLLREKSPKAYMALANWLRTNKLPPDLVIPTKKEAGDRTAKRAGLIGDSPTAQERRRAAWAIHERYRSAYRR